ncbi:alpha/beta fold hydrolase [Halomicrobium urmianum]|uniref:alpha/beta fold hydrolase n=1 Tax=Halomicrobium urmianum TaxID=1586233 RepID=UPI001CDA187B|nr:alpha/beta hydrolase [Halomicrobium urmianum]
MADSHASPGPGTGDDAGSTEAGGERTVDDRVEHHRARVDGVSLHYVTAGPEDGDLVVLLHGFPEFWYSWRCQIPALVDAGYRVLAPDMRGYNRSEAPDGVAAYDLDELVGDVAGLIEHVGRERAHVVGHDWGGLVAWQVGIDRPDAVDRLAVMNAPHPGAYLRDLTTWEQLRKSWYVLAFQVPRLPEWGISRDDFAAFDEMFREGTVRPDAFTDADLERYRAAFRRSGLAGPVNYYRALARRRARQGAIAPFDGWPDWRVDVPTLLLWGERDLALATSLTRGVERWVPELRVERFEDAGHWIHIDAVDRVNGALSGFLAGDTGTAGAE